MKMKWFHLCLALGTAVFLRAQEADSVSTDNKSTATDALELTEVSDSLKIRKNAIGLNAGLQGFGIDYARRLGNHFQARVRYQALNYSLEDYEYEVSGQNVLVDADIKFGNLGLIVDYYPFKNSSFKLMAGGSIFMDNSIDAAVLVSDSLFFGDDGDGDGQGDFVFTPDDIGQVNGGIGWGEFAPYLGLGFGRAVPKNAVGFAIEFGAFYMGEPDVNLTATGMLEDTSEEEAELESNLSELQWLPQVNFRLSFRF